MKFLNHPKSGAPDIMRIAVFVVIASASLKFLVDGISFDILGHHISFGHTDALAYGSLLTPVLGAHGYIERKPDIQVETKINES